jgi:uncharacterized protein (TIGR02145 family)
LKNILFKTNNMKKNEKIIALILTIVILFSFASNAFTQEIKIGTQTWSTKNLDVSTFRNGDPISEVKTNAEWQKAGEEHKPAWCYYNNDIANGKKYGKLYNFYAVSDSRGMAPAGWHIPTFDEWKLLNDFLGGANNASPKLKSTSGWSENPNGNNSSGFNTLPGGYRDFDNEFYTIGKVSYFWTSTVEDESTAWYHVTGDNSTSYNDMRNKAFGKSVRCIKD